MRITTVTFGLLIALSLVQSACAYFIMSGYDSREFLVDTFVDDIVTVTWDFASEAHHRRGMDARRLEPVMLMFEVVDPHGIILHSSQTHDDNGRFGFTAQIDGMYRVVVKHHCVSHLLRSKVSTRVNLHIKVRDNKISADDQANENATSRGHIEVLANSVSRLNERVNLIKLEQNHSKAREERFSTRYAGIGTRVVFFAVFQVMFFIGVGVWLMLNTKKFLIKSKVV